LPCDTVAPAACAASPYATAIFATRVLVADGFSSSLSLHCPKRGKTIQKPGEKKEKKKGYFLLQHFSPL
jgi:hypothetical protein